MLAPWLQLLLLCCSILLSNSWIVVPARKCRIPFLRYFSSSNEIDKTGHSEYESTSSVLSSSSIEFSNSLVSVKEEDLQQNRELEEILYERARRFYDPRMVDQSKEKCIIVAVDRTSRPVEHEGLHFTLRESLDELSELVGTANMVVTGLVVQRMSTPNARTYVGSGKIQDIVAEVNRTKATTLVIDDDLTSLQQRNLEDIIMDSGAPDIKILDRTAVILEIFAQHAKSREGQLQVELAMLEYRLTRGPRAKGGDSDSGCGFRGPGESKLETDKRIIKEKILLVRKELEILKPQRELQRKGRRDKLNLPIVALVGYTNAGKSTLMNRLSRAGVLAENMLFATLDPTTRKVRLPKAGGITTTANGDSADIESAAVSTKGQEVLMSDTVGFISKLPTHLIAAFRATLEEVVNADVLVLVCDRSSPVWEKQRNTVLRELVSLNCSHVPIVELWNKIDNMPDPEQIQLEAATLPIDVDLYQNMSATAAQDKTLPVSDSANSLLETVLGDSESVIVHSNDNDDGYVQSTVDDIAGSEALSTENKKIKKKTKQQENAEFDDLVYRPRDFSKRRYYTVAASAKSGIGMDDFVTTLSEALSLYLVPVSVLIPYSKDEGLVDMMHQQGVVEQCEYLEHGTKVYGRIPEAMLGKLRPYIIKG